MGTGPHSPAPDPRFPGEWGPPCMADRFPRRICMADHYHRDMGIPCMADHFSKSQYGDPLYGRSSMTSLFWPKHPSIVVGLTSSSILPQCRLYLSCIRPHLEYACSVRDPYLTIERSLLEDVQKFACNVWCKNWHIDYESMLTHLNIPSFILWHSNLFYVSVPLPRTNAYYNSFFFLHVLFLE